jgi:hypothetical protein
MPSPEEILDRDIPASAPAGQRKLRRSPVVIRAQLKELLASLPEGLDAPVQDFAARLQRGAWQNHRQELELELEESLRFEVEALHARIVVEQAELTALQHKYADVLKGHASRETR